MPNLVYVSREKSKTYPHHFKAGALNALVSKSVLDSNKSPVLLDKGFGVFFTHIFLVVV